MYVSVVNYEYPFVLMKLICEKAVEFASLSGLTSLLQHD